MTEGPRPGACASVTAFVRNIARIFILSETPLRAAGISYFLFLSIIPILATFLSLALNVPYFKIEAAKALTHLTRWLLPESIHEFELYIRSIADHSVAVSFWSLIITGWVLIKILTFLENTVDTIWRVRTKLSGSRMIKKTLLVAILSIIVISLKVLIFEKDLGPLIGSIVATSMFFLGINKIMPNKKVTWRHALPGSIIGGMAWNVTKWGFTSYIQHFAKSRQLYAILGVFPLFLLWLYVSVLILLWSVCMNSAFYAERHHP